MQGFIVGDKDFGPKYFKERNERIAMVRFIQVLAKDCQGLICYNSTQWLANGSIKSKEHIDEGIDKAADALVAMLEGKNFGKAILKVTDPE
jgi:NADPH-dependent curcumin reductase CurA